MDEKNPSKEQLVSFCLYGSLAPSVHNTQPWAFNVSSGRITVSINPKRKLIAGDPVGREAWISIGASVENIVTAASAADYASSVTLHEGLEKVTVSFTPARQNAAISLEAVENRFTDRSLFDKRPLSTSQLKTIEKSWKSSHAKVITSDDPALIKLVSELIQKGITLALGSSDFRKELSELIVTPIRKQKIGISSASLRLGPIQKIFEPYLVKSGTAITKTAKKERKLWASSAALVFVFSKGDTPSYWLEAGRAYERAALTVTTAGLQQSTSAAVVEATDYHTDIEKYLGIEWRLQTVMRIGHSRATVVHSPRLPLEELLT